MKFHKLTIFFFITVVGIGIFGNAFASPSFPEQFIDGPTSAYFPEDYYEDETLALNLEGAFYKSDGKTLDVRLILHGDTGFSTNNTLSFGMLIDSDSNFDTGKGGFDYRYRVLWDNDEWFEILEELLTDSVDLKEILKKQIESPFFPDSVEHNGLKSSIELSLDLERIGSPELSAIVFFTEGYLTGKIPLVQDVLSLAVIPPPAFTVKTDPSLISFESSTEKIIHIIVESDVAETTDVYYNVYSDSETVKIKELIENSITMNEGRAEIPILLYDEGHNDLKIHNLFVDLNPWYPVNPETRSVERGNEIFETYPFRNQQKADTFTIFWTSLSEPGWDWQLIVQFAMLIGTLIMVGIGYFTYKANSKLANYDRNEKHTHQILSVYDLMLSLISKVDHITKKLTLKYPEKEDDRLLIRTSSIELHTKRDIELNDFNNKNILFYDSAVKHLEVYTELNIKWNLLSKTISQYSKEVDLLRKEIRKTCLSFIEQKLPDFRAADGNSGKIYYLDNIEREAYGVLEDAMNNGHPRLSPNLERNRLSDTYEQIEPDSENDEVEYVAYLDTTLFSSPEPLPGVVNSLLGIVLTDSLKNKFESLIKLEQKSRFQLDAFRIDMKELVKELNHGVNIKGKCKLGY